MMPPVLNHTHTDQLLSGRIPEGVKFGYNSTTNNYGSEQVIQLNLGHQIGSEITFQSLLIVVGTWSTAV
jgi:hypothetical protein